MLPAARLVENTRGREARSPESATREMDSHCSFGYKLSIRSGERIRG
jgi:hypothetical protein